MGSDEFVLSYYLKVGLAVSSMGIVDSEKLWQRERVSKCVSVCVLVGPILTDIYKWLFYVNLRIKAIHPATEAICLLNG